MTHVMEAPFKGESPEKTVVNENESQTYWELTQQDVMQVSALVLGQTESFNFEAYLKATDTISADEKTAQSDWRFAAVMIEYNNVCDHLRTEGGRYDMQAVQHWDFDGSHIDRLSNLVHSSDQTFDVELIFRSLQLSSFVPDQLMGSNEEECADNRLETALLVYPQLLANQADAGSASRRSS